MTCGDRDVALGELEYMIQALRTIVTRGTFNTGDLEEKEETGEAYIERITREGLKTTTEIYIEQPKRREAIMTTSNDKNQTIDDLVKQYGPDYAKEITETTALMESILETCKSNSKVAIHATLSAFARVLVDELGPKDAAGHVDYYADLLREAIKDRETPITTVEACALDS
jgi:hypothetical protein